VSIEIGQRAPELTAKSVHGETVRLTDLAGQPIWLSLQRYAACPFCSLRVHRLIHAQQTIREMGIRLVTVFPSPRERVERYISKYRPDFLILCDPEQVIYGLFGAQTSWGNELRAAANVPKAVRAIARAPNNPFAVDGPIHRMPCEFLIDRELVVRDAHYARDLDGGFDVDHVYTWAAGK
jgi:peroxiredoxin